MEASGKFHAPATLSEGMSPRYPLLNVRLNQEEEGCSIWHYFNYGVEGEDKMIYGSESFHAVPARPYDKGNLEVS